MAIVSGKEIRVNTFRSYQHDPATVALPDGGMVVTWTSDWQDGSGSGVYQQVYNADGSARGREQQVHTITANHQFDTTLNVLEDGGWVVTWSAVNAYGGTDIYQRQYSKAGSPRDDGKIVSNAFGSHPNFSDVNEHPVSVVLKNGDIVTTWDVKLDIYAGGFTDNYLGSFYSIKRSVDSKGSPLPPMSSFVDQYLRDAYDPDIAALQDGSYVITWTSYGQLMAGQDQQSLTNAGEIYQLRVYENGRSYQEVRVNGFQAGNQSNADVLALPGGGYLVTWESEAQDGSGYGIYQKIFKSQVSGDVRVNTYTAGDQFGQQVSLLPNGGWVVVWTSQKQDGSGAGIYQKTFNADGSVKNAEVRVNSTTKGGQIEPQVAVLKDGGWVVAWQSERPNGAGVDIYMQAFNYKGGKDGGETLVSSPKSTYNQPPIITALKNGGWSITWEASTEDGMGGVSTNIYQKFFQKTGAPVIKGSDSISISMWENNALVKTMTATDPEKKAMSWTIDGGEDGGLFRIDSKTGVLTFKAKPDFDAPSDRNKDGVYSVVVKVSDAELQTDKQVVKITLKDVPGKTMLGDSKPNTYGGTVENDFLAGGGGNDTLRGYGDADRLFGQAGADRIYGGSGNDWIDGGTENDVLHGDAGNDIVTGGAGHDRIYGGSENDELHGNTGNDVIDSGSGHDIVYGNDGNDILSGGDGNDSIHGGAGIDGIDGGAGIDFLRGGDGNDGITGGKGSDMVWGEAGNDILLGGLGQDTLFGGSGSDVFVLEIPKSARYNTSEIDTIGDFRPGSDKIDLSGLSWVTNKYELEFKVIAMNIKNESGGITLAGGFRVFYDGDAIVDVKAPSLKYSDFIL